MTRAALLLSLTVWLLSAGSASAGCIGDTRVESYEAVIEPALDCLTVTVVGSECVPGLEITLKSACAEAVALARGFETIEVLGGESRTFDYEEHGSGAEETVEFPFTMGDAEHTLILTYLAKDDMNAYDTCSVGGLGRAPLRGAYGILGLLMLVGLKARRRDRA